MNKDYFSIYLIHPSKILSILLLIVLTFFHLRYGILPGWQSINSDFPNYYTSSKLLLEGKDLSLIYNDQWFQQKIHEFGMAERGKFSPFPPTTVFIMTPIATLSPLIAKRVFLAINVIVLIFTAFIFTKMSQFNFIESLNIIMLSGAALVNNLLLGQFYLILLLLVTLGYLFVYKKEGNEYASGIFWGIAAVLKYFPLVFVPVLLLGKKWKALSTLIITIVALNILAYNYCGSEVYRQYFNSVFIHHLNGELSSQSEYSAQFQSWNALLKNIFVFNPVENKSPLINSAVAFYTVRSFIYVSFLFFSFYIIYKIRKDKDFIPKAIILLSLLVFVLSPASASYHLLILSLPLVLLLNLTTNHSSNNMKLLFIFLYVLIEFSPFIFNKIRIENAGVFLAFYRLWLVIIFYAAASWFIMKNHTLTGDL